MTQEIDLFQTISRHQSPLTQSKSTIKCLVNILEYLDMRITDDTANDLMLLITDHLGALGSPYPHYINMSLISVKVIDSIFSDMVSSGYYFGSRDSFVEWLTHTIDYYDSDVASPDVLGVGITLGLALQHLDTHNMDISAHQNGIGGAIDNWYPEEIPVPVFMASSSDRFDFRKCRQVDKAIYEQLIQRTDDDLIAHPQPDPVLNYNEHDDLAKDIISYEQAEREGVVGIMDSNMLDYEKVLTPVFNKQMDFYTNHLTYALSVTFDAAYTTTITNLRSDVNSFYYKVFDFYTRLYRDNLSIYVDLHINKFTSKTLDMVNLTGLSKSLVSISLIPYNVAGTDYNKLVCSFDNYNPDFTEELYEGIEAGDSVDIRVMVTINDQDEFVVYWAVGNDYGMTTFSSLTRRFNQDPRFLFVSPRVAFPDRDVIRINDFAVFNKSLNHEQALYLISDFNHRN